MMFGKCVGAIVVACLLASASEASSAQQAAKCAGPQLGTWKLKSFTSEDLETHEKTQLYGTHPTGYLGYGSDCRMYVTITAENRRPPAALVATDAESIELYRGLTAYGGTYAIDGDKISHHIDISWNQLWTGTTLVRQFKIEGNTLSLFAYVTTSTKPLRESLFELVWTKVE